YHRCARHRCARPAPTALHTLSLHDALPIWRTAKRVAPPSASVARRPRTKARSPVRRPALGGRPPARAPHRGARGGGRPEQGARRSEEHTSELQSRENLVCRLLLEKKNACSR